MARSSLAWEEVGAGTGAWLGVAAARTAGEEREEDWEEVETAWPPAAAATAAATTTAWNAPPGESARWGLRPPGCTAAGMHFRGWASSLWNVAKAIECASSGPRTGSSTHRWPWRELHQQGEGQVSNGLELRARWLNCVRGLTVLCPAQDILPHRAKAAVHSMLGGARQGTGWGLLNAPTHRRLGPRLQQPARHIPAVGRSHGRSRPA